MSDDNGHDGTRPDGRLPDGPLPDDSRRDDTRRDDTHGDDRDPRLLSGAYALDAVTAEEAAEFEKAADASPALRDEADGLIETASLLGLATAPVQPSEQLKIDLMAKLASTPQLPAQDVAEEPVPEAPVPEAPVPPVSEQPNRPARAGGRAESKARARWFTRAVGILAAAAAAVALFIGGGLVGNAISGNQTGDSVQASAAAALVEITAAGDGARATVSLGDGGTATLVWSNSLGRSAVLLDGLPSLPSDKIYEAWYMNSTGAAAAGTFQASGDGTTLHVLDGTMAAGDQVGVTVEPAGGSSQPTTTPLVTLHSA
jgi:anti-sigma-K factor RskA